MTDPSSHGDNNALILAAAQLTSRGIRADKLNGKSMTLWRHQERWLVKLRNGSPCSSPDSDPELPFYVGQR